MTVQSSGARPPRRHTTGTAPAPVNAPVPPQATEATPPVSGNGSTTKSGDALLNEVLNALLTRLKEDEGARKVLDEILAKVERIEAALVGHGLLPVKLSPGAFEPSLRQAALMIATSKEVAVQEDLSRPDIVTRALKERFPAATDDQINQEITSIYRSGWSVNRQQVRVNIVDLCEALLLGIKSSGGNPQDYADELEARIERIPFADVIADQHNDAFKEAQDRVFGEGGNAA